MRAGTTVADPFTGRIPRAAIQSSFGRHSGGISLVIHAAAQPSHDWAAREPFTDFDINAVGTLNVLEATRLHAPEAPFVFTSTERAIVPRSLGARASCGAMSLLPPSAIHRAITLGSGLSC